LIEEESSWMPAAVSLVRISYQEVGLRETIKAAGGRWNGEKRLWLLTGAAVRRMDLQDRVVGWLDEGWISTNRCVSLVV
jgi:hypothetical protein